jgi:putative Holliday junction resolvase
MRRRGKRPPLKILMELMDQHGIDRVVVGLPLSLDATDSEWTVEVRNFAAKLHERSGRPVFLIDERMTSVMAVRAVRSLGLPRSERERKDRVDTAAAQLILQAFLDHEKRGLPIEQAVPSKLTGNGVRGDNAD